MTKFFTLTASSFCNNYNKILLCSLNAPKTGEQFSCFQIYANAYNSFTQSEDGKSNNDLSVKVLETMERKGFRQQSQSELKSAARFCDMVGQKKSGEKRYFTLISQENWKYVNEMISQLRKERATKEATKSQRQQQALIVK